MCTVSERPPGANAIDPSSVCPIRSAVRFADRADVQQWLEAVRADVEELRDLAHEATARPSTRVLSRPELRRRVDAAAAELDRLLAAGDRGLSHEEGVP